MSLLDGPQGFWPSSLDEGANLIFRSERPIWFLTRRKSDRRTRGTRTDFTYIGVGRMWMRFERGCHVGRLQVGRVSFFRNVSSFSVLVCSHIVPGGAPSLGAISTLTDCRVLSFGLLWWFKYEFWKFLTSSFWDMATLTCIFWEPWKSIYIFLMFLWSKCWI